MRHDRKSSFMSKSDPVAAPRADPLFAWLGPLATLAELGTAGNPRAVRRRLTIVNAMAFLIAIFSAVYVLVFAYFDAKTYMPLIVINLLLMAVALLVPLAHRVNDIAGALVIAAAEYAALFFFVAALGHNSGIQINYIIAAAVAFAIYGLSHFRIVVVVIANGLLLHLAAWYLFTPERALIAADPALLANLYVSSAVTTFCIIALIVGYAFTVADRARAEADALLANILPEAIAERLKERPGERVADSVDDASVLFSDLVGFTELAQRLGAARAVALLDQVVTEFDRLAAAHGVEKIKTTGDGYMAVAGVSQPQADHLPRLARMALGLPDLVERLSATHGVDLKIRVGIAGGPVMAGVIGADKFSYDVWGETVNLASRLESHGLPGEIQVSDPVREALGDSFVFEPRGAIEVKGVGQLETWLLKEERDGRRGSEGREGVASA
jgi:adenylate cyclase